MNEQGLTIQQAAEQARDDTDVSDIRSQLTREGFPHAIARKVAAGAVKLANATGQRDV